MIARRGAQAMRCAHGPHARPHLSARLFVKVSGVFIKWNRKFQTLEYFDNLETSDRSEYSDNIFVETFVHFFTFWEKVNSLFHWFWKYIHILVCRYLFSWMWSRNVFILNIYRNITYIRCMYDAPIQLFFIFKNDRICYLSDLFQSEFLVKDEIWK